MFGIFNAIATLGVGIYTVNKGTKLADAWIRALMSVFGTAFVNFIGWFGVAGLGALVAGYSPWQVVLTALFSASVTTALAVLWVWRRNPLLSRIPLATSGKLDDELLKHLGEHGITYTEGKEGK